MVQLLTTTAVAYTSIVLIDIGNIMSRDKFCKK